MITANDVKNNIRFTTFSANQHFVKLTVKEQKSIFFGKTPFGRKSLKVKPWGIIARTKVAYGQDYHDESYTWEEIAEMVNSDRKAKVIIH